MEVSDLIRKELIIANSDAQSKEEILKSLFERLLSFGYVKESFLDGILTREKTYPTGLFLGEDNVAIPHTDAEHVIKPAIAIATLRKPVTFKSMENPDENLKVKAIFVLALNSPHAQVNVLQQLVNLFQNKDFIKEILRAENNDEIIETIKTYTEVGKKNSNKFLRKEGCM